MARHALPKRGEAQWWAAVQEWCHSPSDGPVAPPSGSEPPAACTLDAAGLAGQYASMRVELYDLSKDDGRNFDFPGYFTNVAMLRENAALVERLYWELSSNVTSWL